LFGEPLPAFADTIAWLAELKTGGDQSFLDDLRSWKTEDAARAALAVLTGETPQGELIGATLRLGKLSSHSLADADRAEAAARALAAAYVGQGFDLTVPYYDLA
jgi:hypothetical protein